MPSDLLTEHAIILEQASSVVPIKDVLLPGSDRLGPGGPRDYNFPIINAVCTARLHGLPSRNAVPPSSDQTTNATCTCLVRHETADPVSLRLSPPCGADFWQRRRIPPHHVMMFLRPEHG